MKSELPTVLGRLEATTVVVGSMIGSGIFLKAAEMVRVLPHPGLLLICWLVAGLLTLSGALVISELSARFPSSGGPYVFLYHAFGPRMAFLFGWSLLAVLQSGSIAAIACGLAQVLAAHFHLTAQNQQLLAYFSILSLTGLHCLSVSLGTRWLQNGLTLIKYLGLLALIAMGMFAGQANLSNLQSSQPLPSLGILISALGVIVLKALWAYDGWANATFIAGEVHDSKRNLPAALVQGTFLVMLAYVLTNATYHLVLSPQDLAATDSPAVTVAQRCVGSALGGAIALLLALSMFGALNSSVLSAPRVYYAMAQSGQFPAWMGATNRFQTPYLSLILQGVWSVLLVYFWQNFSTITDNVVFVYWIFYALTAIAVLKFPAPTEGYRAPARKLLVGIFVTGAVFLVVSQIYQQPSSSLQALGLLLVGNLFYRKSPTNLESNPGFSEH